MLGRCGIALVTFTSNQAVIGPGQNLYLYTRILFYTGGFWVQRDSRLSKVCTYWLWAQFNWGHRFGNQDHGSDAYWRTSTTTTTASRTTC